MDPGVQNLDHGAMLNLCVALDKYCVKSYPRAVIDRLTVLAHKWPEAYYMRVCQFRLPEVAAVAMKASLRSPKLLTSNVLPADYTISMEQYHAFATYQLQCRKKAISVVRDLAWMYAQQPHPPGFYVGQEARARGERTCETCYKSPQHTFYAKSTQSTARLAVGQQFTCNAKLSSWLSYYLDMVELALVQDTAGAVATNHARIDAVFSLRQAIICDDCKTTENALGMVKFAEKLKEEIDKKIATVDISVPGIVQS